jgi:hypothetical protein
MGVACKIVRTDSGVLALDNQGKVSNLYLDLLSYFQNDRLALDYWAMTHTDDFKKAFNGRSDNMSVEDVVAYVNILDVENSELSPSEKYEVTSIMEANNIRDLNELSTKLNKIFKPNGFIELDSVAALDSGIYNEEDLKNINLAEIEYLLHKIEGDLQKGKNFLVEPSQDDVALIDESKKTILGTSFQLSRTDIDNDIISKTDTFTPEAIEEAVQNSDFQSYKDKFNNDEAFRNKETERLSKLSKLPILSFVGETLTSENVSYYDQLLNTIPATFDIVDIESDLDFLEEITPEKWFNNPTQIRNVLREVEQTLAKNNIDLVGLSELYNEREQVLSLITPLKNMIRNTSEITIQEFARAHDQIFTPSENKITRVIPEKYKGLNIVHLNSRKTDAELYREHGLIKLEENMYHKVERLTDTVAAYDYIYTQLVEGKMTIPSQYITVKDYKNPDNKVEVLKGITNFVNSRETGIVSEFQEEISLYQLVFDHNPIQKEDYRKLSTIRTDEVYLKTDFVSDFYSYVLNEKLNDTPIYRETLSKFRFTSSDIEIDGYISSLDGIEMQQELEDYLKLKKGTSYEFMFNNGEGYLLEDSQAINNPESVQAYKSEIVVDGNYVITNPQSDMFVNNEGILYRKVGKSLNADIYLKISEVNRPVYNTAIENFEYNQDEAQAILDKYQNGLDSQKMSFQEFNERLEKAETSPTTILFQTQELEKVNVTPKALIDAVLFKLKETGLANNVYSMTSEEIDAKLEEIGSTEEVRKSLTITPNGFVYNGDVYLNTDNPRILNTQIHEFGHLFNFWAKENRPNLYRKGIQLVQEQGQEYIDKVKESQPNLEGERLYEEALTQLIGDKGELVVNKKRKSAIREWLTDLWNSIKNALGITQYTAEELENITLEQFAEAVAIDMLSGTKFQTSEYTIQPLLDEMFAKKKGKMVNVQTINQILKQPTTKAIEKAIIREVLNLEGFRGKTQIPFDEFRGEVNARIMPLDVIESTTYSDYGSDNVGVDVGFSSTNIYNSKLDHQIDGHFKTDFEKNLDGIEFRVTTNSESGIHYVVDRNSRITPENIEEEAYFMSPSLEMANNWIENYNKTRKINSGQFGHTRVWREAGTRDVYVAEMQSDSYQKAKAVDMVLTNYENNPKDLNSKQKPIYKKIKEAEKLINDIDSSKEGSEEYRVKKLYNDISEVFKSINEDKEEDKEAIKNLNKAIEEAKKENRAFDAIEKQKEEVQRRLKEKEGYGKSLVSLVLGEKIEPVEVQDYQLEGKVYVMPYSFIAEKFNEQKKSYEYRLGTEIFTSLEDAVSYYEKNILPDYKVNKELYTKYFNAKKDLPNLKNSLLDNASLRDKQFIAHRKNYTERLLREEIKRNAELGMETLAIPTPRTLALIEGYMSADEFNLQPYDIVSSRNTDELENGDIIEYLGEDHTVFNANSTDFEAAPTDKVNEFNIDDFVNQEADFYADNDSSEVYSELKDKDLFTKESWDEFKESSNYEYLLPELEDIAELIDEETETYRLDKDKIYDAIREYHFDFIWSEGVSTTLENQGYRVLYEDDYTVYTTEYNVYPETLQQPDQYQEIADIDEFSIEDIDEDYQGILKRYEKTIDFFKKERGENIETITDNKGNEWVRTELTSEDAISPVVAFQMEIPSIKNIPNTITNSKNEVATAIESSFEMLTPTEEETRNKVECQL